MLIPVSGGCVLIFSKFIVNGEAYDRFYTAVVNIFSIIDETLGVSEEEK